MPLQENRKRSVYKVFYLILSILLLGASAALSIKCAVGVGPWDAFCLSVSLLIGMKVGTFAMLLNFLSILIQFLILRKDFSVRHILQIGLSLLLGSTVNFFLYDLYRFELPSYGIRVAIMTLSLVTASFAIASILFLNVVSVPVENTCLIIAQRNNRNFGRLRQAVDVVCILIVFVLFFTGYGTMTIGPGTVIGMAIFGPLIHFFMKRLQYHELRKNEANPSE